MVVEIKNPERNSTMRMKKIVRLIPLVIMAAASSSIAADGDPVTVTGGTVHFTGSIVNAPCAIEIGSDGIIPVDLGQHRAALFTAPGTVSPAKSFNITLNECVTDTYQKATIAFTGDTVTTANGAGLAVTGGATGVAIQIVKNGDVLKLDGTSASPETNLLEGTSHIALQAQYVSIADTVTAGPANSTADFTITYL